MPCGSSHPKWQVFLLLLVFCPSCRADINITDNAYSGILIAIHDEVDEDPSLLQGIREAFTEASKFLYEITGNRAYFSSISILLPASWSANLTDEAAGSERFENSHFRILKSFPEDDPPSVFRTSTVCGESEGHALFAPAHFTSTQSFAQKFGSYGKQIVYQWARTRFGVFDERPQGDEPLLYPVNSGEDYEGSRCSLQIPGQKKKFSSNGLEDCDINDAMNNSCIFIPNDQVQGQYASLLYSRMLNHVSEFCDESSKVIDEALVHNSATTNAQNTNCQGRSVWEVIRDHPDYGEMDPPHQGPSTVPSSPTFRILRRQTSSLVLVLDTSGSMDGPRIEKLSQGVTYFLQNVVQNDIGVGMVMFNSLAFTLRSVSKMSNATRQQFIDAVPTSAGGGTSIGAGIKEAMGLLEDASIHGGILIVVSDGQEHKGPYIRDVYQEILDSGVVVFTIAISNSADTGLESLAQSTGGNSYFTLDSDASNAITEAFLDIGKHLNTGAGQSPHADPIALFSEATSLAAGATETGNVSIENTLGLNTAISFDFDNSQGLEFSLLSPNGRTYDINSTECTLILSIRIINCNFPGLSETGNWQYTVENKASISQRVSVIFRSQARDPNDPPIVARAFWAITGDYTVVPGVTQRIFATVSKGLNAVLGADVTAIVETGTGAPVTLKLADKGTGADLNNDDGIYSIFFTSFNRDGRYSAKIRVSGMDVTSTGLQTILGVPSPASSTSRRRKRATSQPAEHFQRVIAGGTFRALGTASLTSTPLPPGRITDLRVLSTDTSKHQVMLQWTAQGAKLDVGAATEYEIRRGLEHDLSANYSVIMPGDVVQGNLSAPATAGTVEEFTVQLPKGDKAIYFLGIVPKVANAVADISNVVTLTTRPITLASLGVTATADEMTTTALPTTTEVPTTTDATSSTQAPTTTDNPPTTQVTTTTGPLLTTTQVWTSTVVSMTTQVPTTTEYTTTTQVPTTTVPTTTVLPSTINVQTTTKLPSTIQFPTTQSPTTTESLTTTQTLTTTEPLTTTHDLTTTQPTTTTQAMTTTQVPTTTQPTTAPITSKVGHTTTRADMATISLAQASSAVTKTSIPTTGIDDSIASPSPHTSASTPSRALMIGLVSGIVAVIVAIVVGLAYFCKKNGHFPKSRQGRGQRLALPEVSPYVRVKKPPKRSASYQASEASTQPGKLPLAYHPQQYNMNTAYNIQAFFFPPNVYRRDQPILPKPTPTYTYGNGSYWYW